MEVDFSYSLAKGDAGLPALLDALEQAFADRGVPMAVASSVLIAADEVVSNVLNYGADVSEVEVAGRIAGGQVTLRVRDDGAAFDPLVAAEPDTTLSVEDRDIGGLGIHLVRKLMDDVRYERAGKHNCLQFSKSYAASSESR